MNETDRAWAALSDQERAALRRGVALPSEVRSGVVVRDVSHEADRVFEEVRRARGPVVVARIKAGGPGGWTDRAVAELVDRGVLRRLTVTDTVRHRLAAIGAVPEEVSVDAVEIVPGFEGALLIPPVMRRPGSAAA
jgi:hypothetical protein